MKRREDRDCTGLCVALTESEALVLGWLRLLLWILTVNSGDVSSLTAVVATSTTAHAPAEHRSEDDLNSVQVGGEVGPWKTHAHLSKEQQQQHR